MALLCTPYILHLMPKRKRDISGYTLRSTAEQDYGRSKSSFIRDVDGAFERGDWAFLENFRVYLNDGTVIPGKEATKEKMRSVQKMQPWVYIKTAFLETRYWEKNEAKPAATRTKNKHRSQTEKGEAGSTQTLEGASDMVQLKHDLALAQQKNVMLEKENEFLQSELTSRRGELDKVGGIIDSLETFRKGLAEGNSTSNTSDVDSKEEQPRKVIDADVVSSSGQPKRKRGVMEWLNQPITFQRKASSASASSDGQ